MINLFKEDGTPILPCAAKKLPVGAEVAELTKYFETKYFIPFSSMHKYQRKDSAWANQYRTELSDYANGFQSTTSELLPAFIRYDCVHDRLEKINPMPEKDNIYDPKDFGDNWDEQLDVQDFQKVSGWFFDYALVSLTYPIFHQ